MTSSDMEKHQGDLDPELLAKGIIDEESEIPYVHVPITFPNIYGICKHCNRSNSFMNWCLPCISKRFRQRHEDKKWTSGNKIIDEYIVNVQENAGRPSEVVEWIPYERMINIRFFEEEMYIANWMDGYIVEWDYENNNWKRNGIGVEVLLKKIDESCVCAKFPGDLLHKIKTQFQLDTWDIIIKSYGITRDPYTGTYFMVMH
ncbi:11707_t:CDS:2 [Funneliformis caledonium]|uniref:11707_t:CDS:1 n=1 Tax=Funneliformis caledonium TaxID=1117310 RepID=A0A9N9GE39_9GLOM|nr:11707_t:CDS:2 [Funneliformis caledonium]